MECLPRLTHRLFPIPITQKCFNPGFRTHSIIAFQKTRNSLIRPDNSQYLLPLNAISFTVIQRRTHSFSTTARAGWFVGLTKKAPTLPDITKAGDPVLHEPAQEVLPDEIGSDRVNKVIDDMIQVMRKAPGVGLAAPQIGVPLKIIVLEDTKEYISYATKEETKAHDRRPFDLLVIINPKLKRKGNKSALFFEGCLSVDGFRALVERFLEVEVTGLNQEGRPVKIEASGWQARILQHECDHLDGTLYVDKMVPRTFRTVENLDLPLANGCPKLGVRNIS